MSDESDLDSSFVNRKRRKQRGPISEDEASVSGNNSSGGSPPRRKKRLLQKLDDSSSESDDSPFEVRYKSKVTRLNYSSSSSSSSSASSIELIRRLRHGNATRLRSTSSSSTSSYDSDLDRFTASTPPSFASTSGAAGPSSTVAKQPAIISSSSDTDDANSDACPICLAKFRQQEIGSPEGCDHAFCAECIQEWARNVNTCPVDRQPFTTILIRTTARSTHVARTVPITPNATNPFEQLAMLADTGILDHTYCEVCGLADREDQMLLCDECDMGWHTDCVVPRLTTIPVGEWICPHCVQQRALADDGRERGREREAAASEDDWLMDEIDMDEVQLMRLRLVPRTRVSQRVLTNIMARRGEQQAGSSASGSAATTKRSTKTTKTTKTTKRKTTRKKRKTKRRSTARKVCIKYEIDEKTGEKLEIRTKISTKRKPSKRKKKKRARAFVRRRLLSTRAESSVKKRLAQHLGICKKQSTHSLLPNVKINSQNSAEAGTSSGTRRISLLRTQAGIPQLHLFGQRDTLDYFSSDDSDGPGNAGAASAAAGASVVTSRRTPSTSDAAAMRRQARRKTALLPNTNRATSATDDLLGSILQSQSQLHQRHATLSLGRNGTLEITPKPSSSSSTTSRQPQHTSTSPSTSTSTTSQQQQPSTSSAYVNHAANRLNSPTQPTYNQPPPKPPVASTYTQPPPKPPVASTYTQVPPMASTYNQPPPKPPMASTSYLSQMVRNGGRVYGQLKGGAPFPPPFITCSGASGSGGGNGGGGANDGVTTSGRTETGVGGGGVEVEGERGDNGGEGDGDNVGGGGVEAGSSNAVGILEGNGNSNGDEDMPRDYSMQYPSNSGYGHTDNDNQQTGSNKSPNSESEFDIYSDIETVSTSRADETDKTASPADITTSQNAQVASDDEANNSDVDLIIDTEKIEEKIEETAVTSSTNTEINDNTTIPQQNGDQYGEAPHSTCDVQSHSIHSSDSKPEDERDGDDDSEDGCPNFNIYSSESVNLAKKIDCQLGLSDNINDNVDVLPNSQEEEEQLMFNDENLDQPDENNETIEDGELEVSTTEDEPQPEVPEVVIVAKKAAKPIPSSGGLYSDSDEEIIKIDSQSFGISDLRNLTEDISEEERSYTPCLDEKQFKAGLEDLEAISDEEKNDFDESHEHKTASDGDALEINAKESELDLTKPDDYEEGEIVDKTKKAAVVIVSEEEMSAKETEKELEVLNKENEDVANKKEAKKSKDKDVVAEKQSDAKKDKQEEFKKLSKSNKERNYRDKDGKKTGKEKSGRNRSRDKDRDKENRKERKKEKRKEIPRYSVRSLIADKPPIRKDRFGRDEDFRKSPSNSRNNTPPPVTATTASTAAKRPTSKDRRQRSPSISRQSRDRRSPSVSRQSRSRSKSRDRDRGRSYTPKPQQQQQQQQPQQRVRRRQVGRSRSRDRDRDKRSRTVSVRSSRSVSRELAAAAAAAAAAGNVMGGRAKRKKDRSRRDGSGGRRRKERNRAKRQRSRTPPPRQALPTANTRRPILPSPPPQQQQQQQQHSRTPPLSAYHHHGSTPISSSSHHNQHQGQMPPQARLWNPTRPSAAAPPGGGGGGEMQQQQHQGGGWDAHQRHLTPSWTPPRVTTQQQQVSDKQKNSESLTVILTNDRKRRDKRKRERRGRRRRDRTPPPSKEVFASGDNILVSVSFNAKDNANGTAANTTNSSLQRKRKRNTELTFPTAGVKPRRKRRPQQILLNSATTKPVAIIDLERSPFRELTPSPRDIIVLSDSDRCEDGDEEVGGGRLDGAAANGSVGGAVAEEAVGDEVEGGGREQHVCDSSQQVSSPSILTNTTNLNTTNSNMGGPKTPPEPQIKFTLPTKAAPVVRTLALNPLHDPDDDDDDDDDEVVVVQREGAGGKKHGDLNPQDELEHRLNEAVMIQQSAQAQASSLPPSTTITTSATTTSLSAITALTPLQQSMLCPLHRGPNTPPEPPISAPSSPDADDDVDDEDDNVYDPFDPTKSRSPSPEPIAVSVSGGGGAGGGGGGGGGVQTTVATIGSEVGNSLLTTLGKRGDGAGVDGSVDKSGRITLNTLERSHTPPLSATSSSLTLPTLLSSSTSSSLTTTAATTTTTTSGPGATDIQPADSQSSSTGGGGGGTVHSQQPVHSQPTITASIDLTAEDPEPAPASAPSVASVAMMHRKTPPERSGMIGGGGGGISAAPSISSVLNQIVQVATSMFPPSTSSAAIASTPSTSITITPTPTIVNSSPAPKISVLSSTILTAAAVAAAGLSVPGAAGLQAGNAVAGLGGISRASPAKQQAAAALVSKGMLKMGAKPSPMKTVGRKEFQLLDFDSPYSPGSSDYEDLFEPPSELPSKLSKVNSKKTNSGTKSAAVFDNLFGTSPVNKFAKLKIDSKTKYPGKKNIYGKTKMVGVKIDEDSLKVMDEVPNSAVEMQVKDKFLKKLNRQERVVEEVKLVLKPHYNKKHITKEEYKDVLRRAVPKICHNKSGEINPKKIQNLIEAYVKKLRQSKKVTSSSSKM